MNTLRQCPSCKAYGARVFISGGTWSHCSFCDCPTAPLFDRAALVRAILAEQWCAAIALYDPRGNNYGVTVDHIEHTNFGGGWMALAAEDLAALPCAVAVVAERLGER